MRWEYIIENRWFYTMNKTDTIKNIKLSPKAILILKHYGYEKKGFVFPFLTDEIVKAAGEKFNKKIQAVTSLVNKNLKEFAEHNGINKNISTHVARHSFADNARKASGDIYAISKALCHSKIAVTENYLASLDDGSVDDLLEAVQKRM